MRRMLAITVALGPLCVATGAVAETVISNERTTAIATATANSGNPDDISIASGGTIRIGSGAAVTLNSDNDVENDGAIRMEDAADGATGILAQGGNSGDIVNSGEINVADDYTASDTDKDGDLDGPLAEGTGRYGIRVTGDAALDGSVSNVRGGSIRVEGNESFGISVEAGLTGDLTNRGTVDVIGDGSYGVSVTGDVAGDVTMGGVITSRGEGAVAVAIDGDVGGALVLDGAITASGYRFNQRPSDAQIEKFDADDVLQGGPAVRVTGNVAGGILLDRAQPDTDSDEDEDDRDDDEDDDGILDREETTANITSHGSAPALAIGSADEDIVIGAVGEDDRAYGLVNRGSISALGLLDQVAANAVVIGVPEGGAVLLEGGVRNEGAITATAFDAAATALRLNAGVTADAIVNDGTLSAITRTEGPSGATAIDIADGALVQSFTNTSLLQATVLGEDADAVAFIDRNGTVDWVVNSGRIIASITATDDPDDDDDSNTDPSDEVISGEAVAIDLSANTTGVVVRQVGVDDGDDDGNEETEDPDADEDGVDDADEPRIQGNIKLGSGADLLDIQNGEVIGDVSFGLGADNLVIDGGGVLRGGLTDADGLLTIDVIDGVLENREAGGTTVSELNVGADGNLIVTVDPDAGTVGAFNVTGAATFADGAGLGVRFTSLLQDPTRFVIVQAGELDAGELDQSGVEDNTPYLFVAEAGADEAAGQLYLDVRRRTAAEAGLISVETAAFDAVYAALGEDQQLRDAFLAQAQRDGFINLFEQMLPDHSAGPLFSLATGVDAVSRALAGRGPTSTEGETSAWLQEINFYADKDKGEAYGFRSEGFGVAGGIERGTSLGAVGVSAAFTSSDMEDPEAEAEENLTARLLELGIYWRASGDNWRLWARAAAGYASLESTRQFVGEGILRRSESEWSGLTGSAAAGASYERAFGRYTLRPEVQAEFFYLREGEHDETGGGDGFDLSIDERTGHIFSTTAALNIGVGFGENYWLRPELRLGWRQNIAFDGGETIARFRSGGPEFVLLSDSLEGGGPIVGLRLNLGNELGFLSVEADAELMNDYVRYALLLRAGFRF